MKTTKKTYIRGFDSAQDMLDQFGGDGYSPFGGNSDFPDKEALKGSTLLFAVYDTPPYEGYAVVIYRQNRVLYEVKGGHCSCHGLGGQWSPAVVTKKYLQSVADSYSLSDEDRAAFKSLFG